MRKIGSVVNIRLTAETLARAELYAGLLKRPLRTVLRELIENSMNFGVIVLKQTATLEQIEKMRKACEDILEGK